MLKFDERNHSIWFQGKALELQPLSYKLLDLLWRNANTTVSNQNIYESVWAQSAVSAETLKQRIFLLRKALTEAGITDLEIKAIRGEGYRLICQEPIKLQEPEIESKESNFSKPHIKLMFAVIVLCVGVLSWLFWPKPEVPLNNRVVIWTVESDFESGFINQVQQRLKDTALGESFVGQLQFVESQYDETESLPVQARKSRAGLLVLLERINDAELRLQVLEPHTATSLIALNLNEHTSSVEQGTFVIMDACRRLFESGKLKMTKDMRNNSTHPIWAELSAIARERPGVN